MRSPVALPPNALGGTWTCALKFASGLRLPNLGSGRCMSEPALSRHQTPPTSHKTRPTQPDVRRSIVSSWTMPIGQKVRRSRGCCREMSRAQNRINECGGYREEQQRLIGPRLSTRPLNRIASVPVAVVGTRPVGRSSVTRRGRD
jgi:hypothetical protein